MKGFAKEWMRSMEQERTGMSLEVVDNNLTIPRSTEEIRYAVSTKSLLRFGAPFKYGKQ